MKLRNIVKILSIGAIALVMTGCGGGGGSSSGNNNNTSPSTPAEPTVNYGGEPSNPTPISLTLPNVIEGNSFYNYYTYSGEAGDEVIFHLELDREITNKELEDCRSIEHRSKLISVRRPDGTYPTDEIGNPDLECKIDYVYTFEESGEILIGFNARGGNEGEAFVNVY